jgi:hypothetical protein
MFLREVGAHIINQMRSPPLFHATAMRA